MAKNQTKLQKLINDFKSKKIPTDTPGFFDHPNFLEIERDDPDFLDNYARFVNWQQYDQSYLDRAKRIVEITADCLHDGLIQEGRLGGCIDTSMTMGRVLDLHGVWNYVVRGSLGITFPDDSGYEPFCFHPVDIDDGSGREFGHKWVYAPPFVVVDATLQLQEYEKDFAKLLPDTVLLSVSDAKKVHGRPEDILCPSAIHHAERMGQNPDKALATMVPKYVRSFSKHFTGYETIQKEVVLKYIPVGIGGSDDPLEKINSYQVKGKSAYDYYCEEIKPKLDVVDKE